MTTTSYSTHSTVESLEPLFVCFFLSLNNGYFNIHKKNIKIQTQNVLFTF